MERSKDKNYKTYVGVDAHIGPSKGITLVALVITIIILLILAGITINLTIGQRGILRRAEEAGRNYQEAAKQEDEMLKELLNIKEEKWVLADTYTSPNYPSNYPNNSNLNVRKVYDEDIKAITLVIKDIQVELRNTT